MSVGLAAAAAAGGEQRRLGSGFDEKSSSGGPAELELGQAAYALEVRNDHERRLLPLAAYRYVPDDLAGVVALLLFFVALLLGAAIAVGIHALIHAQ